MVQLLRDHYGVDERWRFADTRGRRPPCRRSGTPRPPPRASTPPRRATRWWRRRSPSAAATSGASSSSSCASPGCWAGTATGEGMDRARASALRVPLDLPSVFQGVTRNRTMFVGRPGPEEANRALPRGHRQEGRHHGRGLPDRAAGPGGQPGVGRQRVRGGRARRPGPAARPHAEDPPGVPAHHPGAGSRRAGRKPGPGPARRKTKEESE